MQTNGAERNSSCSSHARFAVCTVVGPVGTLICDLETNILPGFGDRTSKLLGKRWKNTWHVFCVFLKDRYHLCEAATYFDSLSLTFKNAWSFASHADKYTPKRPSKMLDLSKVMLIDILQKDPKKLSHLYIKSTSKVEIKSLSETLHHFGGLDSLSPTRHMVSCHLLWDLQACHPGGVSTSPKNGIHGTLLRSPEMPRVARGLGETPSEDMPSWNWNPRCLWCAKEMCLWPMEIGGTLPCCTSLDRQVF